jgi:hypothetical protein
MMFSISGHHLAEIRSWAFIGIVYFMATQSAKNIKLEEIYFDTLTRIPSKQYIQIQFLPHEKLHYVSIKKSSWVVLLRKIIVFYYDNHTKPMNIVCRKNADIFSVKQEVRTAATVL